TGPGDTGPGDTGPGDPAPIGTFEEFVAAESALLMRLAFARSGNVADAEDLVQETLIAVAQRWVEVARFERPAQWACRVLLNRSVSRWRTLGRQRVAVSRLAARPADTASSEPVFADEALWSAVRSLPPRQRDVTLLLFFEDQPVSEVAATLDCGEGTVRTHWRRARAKLAEVLDEADDLEDR
ncbi:MAG: RNA polymerase sigma factor, partial [Microthrixaceae bacterium]